MYNDITVISGIVSCYIFNYNNKKYYLFGDQHFSRSGSCQDKGLKCDYFNYTFTNTNTYGSNCTSIGVMLHNWFIYNNDHNIKTDFYMEENYVKGNERSFSTYYTDIIKNRQLNKLTYNKDIKEDVFKDNSWLQLLTYIMEPCFLKDKINCPYYPSVHFHYIDIRYVDTTDELISVDPFSLDYLIEYINNNKIKNIDEYYMLKDAILILINYILNNYSFILYGLLDIYGYEKFKNVKMPNLLKHHIFNNVSLLTVDKVIDDKNITMYKAAWEIYRLKLKDKVLATKLIDYIDELTDTYINKINNLYTDDENILLKMENYKISDERKLIIVNEELLNLLKKTNNNLLPLRSMAMDAYTLARIFLQEEDAEEIIIYAGHYHINNYINFFKNILNVKVDIDVPYIKNNRCLKIDTLPNFLDANKHREYILNKN